MIKCTSSNYNAKYKAVMIDLANANIAENSYRHMNVVNMLTYKA